MVFCLCDIYEDVTYKYTKTEEKMSVKPQQRKVPNEKRGPQISVPAWNWGVRCPACFSSSLTSVQAAEKTPQPTAEAVSVLPW